MGALPSWKRWMSVAASASRRSSGTARVMRPMRSASAARDGGAAQQHLERLLAADQARQQRGRHRVEHATAYLGVTELRAGPGQHHVARRPPGCSRRPGPAPPPGPAWACRACRGSRRPPWNSSSMMYARSPMWSARSKPAEKYLPVADEHHQLDVALVLEGLERGVELLHHLDREHVRGRPVQVDARDSLGRLQVHEAVRHAPMRRVDVDVVRIVLGVVRHSPPPAASIVIGPRRRRPGPCRR